jgi:threonine dehydratase
MRLVRAPLTRSPSATFPDAARLDAARELGARFPSARLRETSLTRVPDLDARADPSGATRVWLALEALQVTGSFKVRGALLALERLAGTGVRAIAASAGNHGVGVAYAGNVLGVPAAVVVPPTAARAKREKIAAFGAELIVSPSPGYDDAEDLARELAEREGHVFVSAYDDLDVVAGNGASLGYEIVRGLGGVPDATIAPIGGGGLSTGLALAMSDEACEPLDRIRSVWGIQSEVSPAMARSLEAGSAVVRLSASAPTLAEGLEGGIATGAFERARSAIAGVFVVTEADIARAMVYAHRELGLVLEGSAAVALIPALRGLPDALRGGDVVCVLTGRNVDEERLERILADDPHVGRSDRESPENPRVSATFGRGVPRWP